MQWGVCGLLLPCACAWASPSPFGSCARPALRSGAEEPSGLGPRRNPARRFCPSALRGSVRDLVTRACESDSGRASVEVNAGSLLCSDVQNRVGLRDTRYRFLLNSAVCETASAVYHSILHHLLIESICYSRCVNIFLMMDLSL